MSYVHSLEAVVEAFYLPLQRQGLLDPDELNTLFSNLPTLLSLNRKFLSEVTDRVKNFSDQSTIGDLLLQYVPFFKLYTAYVSNHQNASLLLSRLRSRAWNNFCDMASKHPKVKGTGLASFLIMPVQRIPRYLLLAKETLKHTKPEHPDYQLLTKAMEGLDGVATHINEQMKLHDNQTAIATLERQFEEAPCFVSPTRILLRQAQLVKKTSQGPCSCLP